MGNGAVTLNIFGQTISLLPQRCVFWHEAKTLIASDLHWGKVEVFHSAGIPVPPDVFHDDLRRLGTAIESTGARRLFILGDLIHARSGITRAVDDEIISWRQHHDLPIDLIKGNHDRGIDPLLKNWHMRAHADALSEGPFIFSHHEIDRDLRFNWCGHIHPTVRLGGGAWGRMRFSCFALSLSRGLLPAFSHFTGGQNLKPDSAQKIYAVVENEVLPI